MFGGYGTARQQALAPKRTPKQTNIESLFSKELFKFETPIGITPQAVTTPQPEQYVNLSSNPLEETIKQLNQERLLTNRRQRI